MHCVLLATALAALPLDSSVRETSVRLCVWPMPAPIPALKVQLLPEVTELNPGSAAQNYLKCFAEQRNFFFSKEALAERARYRSMPLAELPVDKLLTYGGFALRHADWAARLDSCDWGLLQHVQAGEMDLLLPHVGRLQMLAEALQVRFRGEVADRRFDAAVRTAKTMFALARHLGEYPRQAGNMVGLSVADLALHTLEEMIQRPGCPNLYWALTDLPSPLVDLRKGVQGDRAQVAADLRLLRDDAPMTDEQLEEFVSHLSGVLGFARAQAGQAPQNLRAVLAARAKDADQVRAARSRLIEPGSADDVVQRFPAVQALVDLFPGQRGRTGLIQRFPPLQVILLDEKRAYEVRRDESLKLLALAPGQIDALAGSEELSCCSEGLFADFLPRVLEARRFQARLEQRIGLLRHVEALRLYAAGHGGRLPEKLSDIAVPLPPDPFTGKPFLYQVAATAAYLRGSPPRGEEQNPCFNIRYEVTIEK